MEEVPRYLKGAQAGFVEAADLRLATTDGQTLPAHRQMLARCCAFFAGGLSFQRSADEAGPSTAGARRAGAKRKQPTGEGGAPAVAAADTIAVNVPAEAAELFLDLAYNPSNIDDRHLAGLPNATYWAMLHQADLFGFEALATAMAADRAADWEVVLARIKTFNDLREAIEAARSLPLPALRDQLERTLGDPAAGKGALRCLRRVVARRRDELLPLLEWASAEGHRNLLRLCIAEVAHALGPDRLRIKASNEHTSMSLRLRPRKSYWTPSRPRWSRQQALALLRGLNLQLLGADGVAQLLDIMTAASMHDGRQVWQAPSAAVAWQAIGDHAAAAATAADAAGEEDSATRSDAEPLEWYSECDSE